MRSISASKANTFTESIKQLAKAALDVGNILGLKVVENKSAALAQIKETLKHNRVTTAQAQRM